MYVLQEDQLADNRVYLSCGTCRRSENQRRDSLKISIMHYGTMFAVETADEIAAVMTAAIIPLHHKNVIIAGGKEK